MVLSTGSLDATDHCRIGMNQVRAQTPPLHHVLDLRILLQRMGFQNATVFDPDVGSGFASNLRAHNCLERVRQMR